MSAAVKPEFSDFQVADFFVGESGHSGFLSLGKSTVEKSSREENRQC